MAAAAADAAPPRPPSSAAASAAASAARCDALARRWTHRRNVNRLWLMLDPSWRVCFPRAVCMAFGSARSGPGEVHDVQGGREGRSRIAADRGGRATRMRRTACERDDTAFIAVRPTERRAVPSATRSMMASAPVTVRSSRPCTCVSPVGPLMSLMGATERQADSRAPTDRESPRCRSPCSSRERRIDACVCPTRSPRRCRTPRAPSHRDPPSCRTWCASCRRRFGRTPSVPLAAEHSLHHGRGGARVHLGVIVVFVEDGVRLPRGGDGGSVRSPRGARLDDLRAVQGVEHRRRGLAVRTRLLELLRRGGGCERRRRCDRGRTWRGRPSPWGARERSP